MDINETTSEKKRILAMDDLEGIRNIYNKFLSGNGYNLTVLEDGIDAHNLISSQFENGIYVPFDLMIVDNTMKYMHGVEFLNNLYELGLLNKHRYLLSTGDTNLMQDELGDLLDDIDYDIIKKPFKINIFQQKVKYLLSLPLSD